ncbi:MAG TPA: hypothetical protein VNW95_05680 [Mucilaginibacter sp.]|nr:hypothetical protein [Mucilaginibacter sp.]
MELEELKTLWSDYDKKLDKNLQLNMLLLRKMNFDKARFKIKSFFVLKIVEMLIMNYTFNYLIGFIVHNSNALRFSIPAIIIELALLWFFILDLKILSIVGKLQLKNNDEPIAPLQKRAARLKLLVITYVKYSLFIIPFYPLLMILIGKIFLKVDFFSPQLSTYFFVNVVVGLCLLPVFIWIYNQLSKGEIKTGLVKNLLSGTGWHQANDVEQFLNEIEKFEQKT